jgi:galactokinase
LIAWCGHRRLQHLFMILSELKKHRDHPAEWLEVFRGTYPDDQAGQLERLWRLIARFEELYGDGPVSVLRAPARINLLGEHVDYVSYLPTASLTLSSSGNDMWMLFRPAPDNIVKAASTLSGCDPFRFSLLDDLVQNPEEGAEGDWEAALFRSPAPPPHWGNYIRGAAFFCRCKFGSRVSRGFECLVDSTIPPAGGASSSSALTVLGAAATLKANQIFFDPLTLAKDASRAEWYVGTRGGAMDHLTMCVANSGHLVQISYSSMEARSVPIPDPSWRLLTFFTRPADKSREIMLEYNERAAVSRIIIPALLGLKAGEKLAVEGMDEAIDNLPDLVVLREFAARFPAAFRECEQAFPALVRERMDQPLKVRDRARHHAGEVRRVTDAGELLEHGAFEKSGARVSTPAFMRIGELILRSHLSLRDSYQISTTEVDELVSLLNHHPGVAGARLMGGGFGGNVLALTTAGQVETIEQHVQTHYYKPRERNGRSEGSIMISTPAQGFSGLDPEAATRAVMEKFGRLGSGRGGSAIEVPALLDEQEADPGEEFCALIVAAGRGARAKASGLEVVKPLAEVLGVPSIRRVLSAIRASCCLARPPVIIVSPETEAPLRDALQGEEVEFILQPRAMGTGDAVLCARPALGEFCGRALVVWATQPVLQSLTVARTIKLSALFPEFEMIVPTAFMKNPYAPVERDADGEVSAASETHLEKAPRPDFGESNVGLFLLRSRSMFAELAELRKQWWNEAGQIYARTGGELGFPNELIRSFAARRGGVMASPVADWREEKGIKTLADVETCEQYLRELGWGR